MTDKSPEADEKAAETEFQRVLGNLAKMPPKPHAPLRMKAVGDQEAKKKRSAPPKFPVVKPL